jgi:hypothetical protein
MEYALLFLRLGRATVGALLVELKEEPNEALEALKEAPKEALLIFPPDTYIYIYICTYVYISYIYYI